MRLKGPKMKLEKDGMLLRVLIDETDIYKGKNVYEQIVLKAKELNLAGATVIRGIMGYGMDKRMHSAKLLRLSENLPIIVEIIDTQENLNKLLPFLDEVVQEGLITLDKNVKIIKYKLS